MPLQGITAKAKPIAAQGPTFIQLAILGRDRKIRKRAMHACQPICHVHLRAQRLASRNQA